MSDATVAANAAFMPNHRAALSEAYAVTTLAFSGVRAQVIGDATHLMFYVEQPTPGGDVERIVIARMAAPTSTVWATAETILGMIAPRQLALTALNGFAN